MTLAMQYIAAAAEAAAAAGIDIVVGDVGRCKTEWAVTSSTNTLQSIPHKQT